MSHTPAPENLKALIEKGVNASDNNCSVLLIEAGRKAYASYYAHILELQEAQQDGILSITIHTRTGDILVPITEAVSGEIAEAVIEMVDKKLKGLQKNILAQLEEVHHEQNDADGTSDRAQVFALCMPQAGAAMKALSTEPDAPRRAEAAA
jgi:hypothetical protein